MDTASEIVRKEVAKLFPALRRRPYDTLPAVEIYHTTRVNVRYRLNHTDLCLPVVAG